MEERNSGEIVTGPGNDRRENALPPLPLSRKYRGDTRSLRVPRRLSDSSSPAVGICFVRLRLRRSPRLPSFQGDENRTNPGGEEREIKVGGRADDVSGG